MAEYIERRTAIEHLNVWCGGCGSAVECILAEPAADVAPVVHGRWDGDTCTACKLPWKYNMVQDADDWGYFDPMPDYWPNCGAKLDGGAENGRRRGNAHAQD